MMLENQKPGKPRIISLILPEVLLNGFSIGIRVGSSDMGLYHI